MPAPTPETAAYQSIHGRRLGLVGDGLTSKGLLVDGKFISARQAPKAVVTGHNGAGACTLTGARVGDAVAIAVNLTTPGDASASFETTITVNDQIQQTSGTDLSAAKFLIEITPNT